MVLSLRWLSDSWWGRQWVSAVAYRSNLLDIKFYPWVGCFGLVAHASYQPKASVSHDPVNMYYQFLIQLSWDSAIQLNYIHTLNVCADGSFQVVFNFTIKVLIWCAVWYLLNNEDCLNLRGRNELWSLGWLVVSTLDPPQLTALAPAASWPWGVKLSVRLEHFMVELSENPLSITKTVLFRRSLFSLSSASCCNCQFIPSKSCSLSVLSLAW